MSEASLTNLCDINEDEVDIQRKMIRDCKVKLVQHNWGSSCSEKNIRKSTASRKYVTKKDKTSNVSNKEFTDLSLDEISKLEYSKKANIVVDKKVNKIKNHNLEDSSVNETNIKRNKKSNVSKNYSNYVLRQNKPKNVKLHNVKFTGDKSKMDDISSESEDEDIQYEKRNRKKYSTNLVTLGSNNEKQTNRKHNKLLKRQISESCNSDSDCSSGKEFQKIKMIPSKLVDLNKDYTKSPNSEVCMSRKDNENETAIDEQQNQNFNNVKKILNECKRMCSDFQMYIESVENCLHYKKHEEKIILKSAREINKLKSGLSTKQKYLATVYQTWSKSSMHGRNITKRSHKEIIDADRSSEKISIHEDHTQFEDNSDNFSEQEDKDVSECDSEEIFSANETKMSNKKDIYLDNVNTPKENDRLNYSEKGKWMDISNDNDKNNVSFHNHMVTSSVSNISKRKKINLKQSDTEQLAVKCTNNSSNHVELNTDIYDNDTENEYCLVEENKKQASLHNNSQNKLVCDISTNNQSLDMFDTSLENLGNSEDGIEMQEIDEEANCSELTLSFTNISSNGVITVKTLPNKTDCINNDTDKVPGKSNEEKELVTNSKKVYVNNSKETNSPKKADIDNDAHDRGVESHIKTEALAKKALLESDSDISENILTNVNVNKQVEKLNINDINSKENNIGSDISDVDSCTSTVILSTFAEGKDTLKSTDTDEKSEVNSSKDTDSLNKHKNVDSEAEEAAKKALLESDSDNSIIFPSLKSEQVTKKQTKSNVTANNVRAKQELLISSNSESSSFDLDTSETDADNPINVLKRNREPDTDSSLVSTVKRRFQIEKNYYYTNDKKLRMFCKIFLTRLDKKTLKYYSNALRESRQYLEHKAFKSLVDLDKLEKRYKKITKKDTDTSMDDDASSLIIKKSHKSKEKAPKVEEESLMDYLEKIENACDPSPIQMDSNSENSFNQATKVDNTPLSNKDLISKANIIAKRNLLYSSDSDMGKEEIPDSSDGSVDDDENKKLQDTKKKPQKELEETTSKHDENKKEKNDKSNWKRNKILTMKFSDSDSDIEKGKWDKKQDKLKTTEDNNTDYDNKEKLQSKKKKKSRRRILDSDSDIKLTDCQSDSDNISKISSTNQNGSESDDEKRKKEKQKRKRRKRDDSKSCDTDSSFEEKKSKSKRKRIKKMASDSDSDAIQNSQETPSPGKSGRKNIRKVLKDKQVADDTKQAAKEEEERLKRIAERQALYNEMYEMRLAGEQKVEKLVLDFDTETKKELVSVHEELVKRLKPHQAQGIKFMWDACFESVERIKTNSGSGCIIAHCMGLGKTLQVVTLTYTLLTHEMTGVKTILVVCPLSTVLNWVNEYNIWLKNLDDDINIYELTKLKKNFERKYQLQRWKRTGGVLIIGYEMFRNLTGVNRNIRKGMKEAITECLVDPGADLVVCDEGHLLKNEETALSKCMKRVKTLRRIVLTGTPLQNNLTEYHCMVQFVKPNLLGTKKEFLNRFVNPITNGQFDDSTDYDVKLMKKRAHVLHKMLEGSVQRFDYSVLTPFLPPKQEYVIFVKLTEPQIKMYQYYLDNLAKHHRGAGGALFADFQSLQRIWTHPVVLRLNAEKIEKANEKKELSSDSEGSLKDFIDDGTTGESSSNSREDSSDSDIQAIDNNTNVSKRKTRNNPGEDEIEPLIEEAVVAPEAPETEWWSQFVQPEHYEDMRVSAKLLLLFGILKEAEQIGDKVLVFSQSLYSLTLIEEFLARIDDETQKDTCLKTLDNHSGSWSLGLDYFRLDGQTSAENRSIWCKIFNKPTNTRARLFLISTRAGGLGINLTAANRVIIFDASWNPSHDVQSIFRIYRFGQKKPCYVYRFLAAGTMEEKIYNRQVTKLSLSCRVVDEQQIERHYSNHDLNELYMFESYSDSAKRTLNLPKDRLLAEIFLKYKDVVENYHEHDSLLENKAEEELDEEERKQAWLEYEEEKKGKPMMNAMSTYQNNMLLHQYNMMINSNQSGIIPQNLSLQLEYENLQQLIRKDYPNATLEQQKMMTNRALVEMYNYWEQQAVLQPVRNQITPAANFQQRINPPTGAQSNQLQMSQINHSLAPQSGNYVNVNKATTNVTQKAMVLNPFTYRSVPINNAEKIDDDIVEVIPTTSNMATSSSQVAVQSVAKTKNQEE